MNESITKRVSRIISGSFNALVNKIENSLPNIVMEEAIREIESVVDEVRVELGKVIAAKHLSNKRLAEKNNVLEALSQKIELAISANREDLAKAAISHQLDIEAQIPILEQAINDSIEKEKELEGYLSALLAKRRELKEELKHFEDSQQSALGDHNEKTGINQKVDKATTTFERVLEKQTGAPNSLRKTSPYLAELAELEKLSHDNRIEERFKKFKALQNAYNEGV